MFKKSISREEFGTQLDGVVSPAQPIQSIEHLVWRHEELARIEKALFMTGRHIFIYGDRGVGKSSLAATAATQWQSSDAEPIRVACGPDGTLESVVANIAYIAIQASRLHNIKSSRRAGLNLRILSVDAGRDVNLHDLQAQIRSGIDAVEILREAIQLHSERSIIVIDEFDRIASIEQRARFADLIKQLGDRGRDIRIIFAGVGRSLQDLLGAHASAIRQLDTILLATLPWDGRFQIVTKATNAFELKIDHEIVLRIAAVSDGYPSYIHKITEKMLWRAYEDTKVVHEIGWPHYHGALNDAISESYASFAEAYGTAVNQQADDYEEVLWSTADSDYLQRYITDMYSSYEYIMEKRTDRPRLDADKYSARIRSLRGRACGEILTPVKGKRGMYQFRENMFRGYVRLQAEAHGVELVGKSHEIPIKQVSHVPASAGRGYYASKPPKGVHLDRKRRNGK